MDPTLGPPDFPVLFGGPRDLCSPSDQLYPSLFDDTPAFLALSRPSPLFPEDPTLEHPLPDTKPSPRAEKEIKELILCSIPGCTRTYTTRAGLGQVLFPETLLRLVMCLCVCAFAPDLVRPGLRYHMKTQHSNNPSASPAGPPLGTEAFKCAHCARTFDVKASLSAHMQVHSAPLVCGICPETFTKKTSLMKHRLLHQDSNTAATLTLERRSFTCDFPDCGRSFLSEVGLNHHKNTSHSLQPFELPPLPTLLDEQQLPVFDS
eukprot:m.487913 g.487913  ORF g.487913 m.487913 type:complete len:262 (-) comp57231_c0_seq12:139-924(-)